MAFITDEQLAHLKDHQDLFDEHQQEKNADIEEYFRDLSEDTPGELYVCLCADLDIDPVGQPQVTWTLGLEDAELLWDYLHHNRPGGYQHVHDSLLDAIREARP